MTLDHQNTTYKLNAIAVHLALLRTVDGSKIKLNYVPSPSRRDSYNGIQVVPEYPFAVIVLAGALVPILIFTILKTKIFLYNEQVSENLRS